MKETLKRQRLFFISIIGIVVVSLIMGTTFAYQTISMNETETRKVVLEAGVLDVSFETTNLIETSNMPLLPVYSYADYTEFTVDNTKSSADVAFKIGLVDIEYGYVNDSGTKVSGCRTETTVQAACIIDENFKYTIVEVVDEEETMVKEGNFADLASTEIDLSNYITITKGTTKTYRLYLWLNETDDNQNHLENTYFKGKLNVTSVFVGQVNPYANNKNSLAYHIINNAINVTEGEKVLNYAEFRETPKVPLSDISYNTETTLTMAEDEYGTSYYFRGVVSNNYVTFNNMCWRIVRIEGNGSIKIILTDKSAPCSSSTPSTTAANAFSGSGSYGYNISSDRSYAVLNYVDSDMHSSFETWLNGSAFTDSARLQLKDDDWCVGNLRDAFDINGNIIGTPEECFASNTTFYYSSYFRNRDKTFSLVCDDTGSDEEVSHGKIGTLTMDEIMFARAMYEIVPIPTVVNETTYLTENGIYGWYTLTPYSNSGVFSMSGEYWTTIDWSVAHIYRPAVTLIEDIEVSASSGDGSVTKPYVID